MNVRTRARAITDAAYRNNVPLREDEYATLLLAPERSSHVAVDVAEMRTRVVGPRKYK